MTEPWSNQIVSQVIIAGPGGELLVYSPTVGAGNLIASIAASATTDPYGNVVLAGVTSYGPEPGGVFGALIAVELLAGGIRILDAPGFAGPYTLRSTLNFTQVAGAKTLLTSSTGVLGITSGNSVSGFTIADGLTLGGGQAFKTADTNRTNTTTLTADPDLQITNLIGGATYYIQMGLVGLAGQDNPGLKWQFGGTGLPTTSSFWSIQIASGGTLQIISRVWNNIQSAVEASQGLFAAGVLVAAGSGTVSITLTWAQNTSSGTATTVGAGSYLIANRVT